MVIIMVMAMKGGDDRRGEERRGEERRGKY